MADLQSEFESRDTEGTSDHYSGSAGTGSFINVPTTGAGVIAEFLVENTDDTDNLLVSLDGGTGSKTLQPGDIWQWTPKGNLTQIKLKGSGGSCDYEVVLNRELP